MSSRRSIGGLGVGGAPEGRTSLEQEGPGLRQSQLVYSRSRRSLWGRGRRRGVVSFRFHPAPRSIQNHMRTYVLNRLILTIPVLFGVSVVIFLLMKLIPGDAAGAGRPERDAGRGRDDPRRPRSERAALHPVRKVAGAGGARRPRPSIEAARPMATMVLERFKNTVILAAQHAAWR